MNKGINQLANVFQKRVADMTNKPSDIEFGTITGDMSLKPDGYDIVIPDGDYSVLTSDVPCEGFEGCSGSENCAGFSGCKGHGSWKPKAGDRCLVLWVGSEAVVIGKIN